MSIHRTHHSEPQTVDLRETRRRFLLAREQASQSSAERYHAVRKLRDWPRPERCAPRVESV
jgi:hypothetical protein